MHALRSFETLHDVHLAWTVLYQCEQTKYYDTEQRTITVVCSSMSNESYQGN
jgi:hypothetical protein